MTLAEQFEAEARLADRTNVSDIFYGAYVAYVTRSLAEQIGFVSSVIGSVEGASRVLNEEVRPLSQRSFRRLLRDMPLEQRIAFARKIAGAAKSRQSDPT